MSSAFDPQRSARRIRELLTASGRVTAVCHENPDADTIAGAVAMALIATRLGATAEVVSADPPSNVFDYLPGFDRIRTEPSLEPGVAVICDAATFERVGRIATEHREWFAASTLVNIDHHVTNSYFGALNCVDPAAAATCQVIAEMLPDLGVVPDGPLADVLLTGIVRDSQGFSTRSTSPQTLRLAARLLEAGADLSGIHRRILAELPYPTIALWGRLLAASQQAADGLVVHTTLIPAMLEETATSQDDADGLVEFLANSRDALITILFRELSSDRTRVSFRVAEPIDATRLAAPFGGGGHRVRAGCTVAAGVEVAAREVLAVCARVLAETVNVPVA